MAHSCCPSPASVPSTSSWHRTRSDGGQRVRWGTEVEKGAVRSARARLPWALLPPFFLYWSISSGPGGGRRGGEESETRWLPSTVPGSYPVLPGRNLSPAPDKWGAETQSCVRERKATCSSGLGWLPSPPKRLILSPFHLLLLTFSNFLSFLLKKTCTFFEGDPTPRPSHRNLSRL